jgi:hypothetical protein
MQNLRFLVGWFQHKDITTSSLFFEVWIWVKYKTNIIYIVLLFTYQTWSLAVKCIVPVCVFACHMFSYHPFYFDFHSARIIFDVSSGFYFWNVNRTPTWHLSKMFKVAFKDVSTKNSEPTYWTILFVMLKIELCRLPLRHRLFLSCDCHGVTDRTCKQKSWLKCACFLYRIPVTLQCMWFQH